MASTQEIESASTLLFDKLTLQEKSLAKELVAFSNYDRATRIGRYRAPVLYLDTVITSLAASSKGDSDPPRNLLIYCDVLVCNGTVAAGSVKAMIISIFARKIVHVRPANTAENLAAIRFQVARMSNITVWAQKLPTPFIVEFASDSGVVLSKELAIPEGSPGFNAFFDGANVVVKGQALPNVELSFENWMNILNDDGTLREVPFLRDNMPRLLQYQFLVAASQVYENPEFALQLLNWIVMVTQTGAGSILNFQAQQLRNSLSLNATIPADGKAVEIRPSLTSYSVPSVNLQSCKQILKARLQAASAFEQSFQNFLAQERSSANWSLLGNDLIIKSDKALEEYKFLRKTVTIRYDDANSAHDKAKTRFEATKVRVDQESEAFQQNVEKWKSDMKDAAALEILKGVVEIGIAFAATVATAGAATPALVAAGASMASKAAQMIKLWEKVKMIIKELKAIFDKLKPTLKALGQLFEKIKLMADQMKNLNPTVPSQDLQKVNMNLDALNAIAQWRYFDVQVELLKESLAACDIPDKDKYYLALKALVIDGQTFIQAQTELITRGDELAVITLRLRQEERARPALENMVKHFQNDTNCVQMLKIAMFDRLLAIRSLVFVDMYSYASAYMFHSLDTWVPITLSPTKPIVDYLSDAATLQGAVVAFGSKSCVQKKIFTLPYSAESASQLLQQLSTDGKFELRVSPDDTAFEGVCRVRLSQARFRFHGAKTTAGAGRQSLRLALSTSPDFYDICFPDRLPTSTLIRSFRGDQRRVIYEQELESGRILCDGDFGLKSDYLMLTPFTKWTVQVGAGSVLAKDIDATSISGASLELTCEVCFLD